MALLGVFHIDQPSDYLASITRRLPGRADEQWSIWSDNSLAIGMRTKRPLQEFVPRSSDHRYSRYRPFLEGSIFFNSEINGGSHMQPNSVVETLVSNVGLKQALRAIDGKFALALWDAEKRLLHLARDRTGQASLYYSWLNGSFVFSTTLAVFSRVVELEIDRGALTLYLRHSWIPAPYTIYKGVYKLLPGTTLSLEEAAPGRRPEPEPYWSLKDCVESGRRSLTRVGFEEAIERCHHLLLESVRSRLPRERAGAFLSAGIDSTTVVALAQSVSSQPLKTFTIGFHEVEYSEATHARRIAKHIGTDHTELHLSAEDLMRVVPELHSVYDEPFADSSQVPTLLVSRLAGQSVSVVLSGDGGDEVFAGYNRYTWGSRIWARLQGYPTHLRAIVSRLIASVSPKHWNAFFGILSRFLPRDYRVSHPGFKLHKLAGVLDVRSVQDLYYRLTSLWRNPTAVVINGNEPPTAITDSSQWPAFTGVIDHMMYLDTVAYLPDDILVKVGQAASSAGIDVRPPLLDARVVEFAWSLPLDLHIRNVEGKQILREILYRYVPRELMNHPKTGFGVPLGPWLRGPLLEWAESLLQEQRIKTEGYFRPEPIRHYWKEHLSGKRDWSHQLWSVLLFQAWLEATRRETVSKL